MSKANAAFERVWGDPPLTAGALHPDWLCAPEALAVAFPGASFPHAVRATATSATHPSLLIERAIEAGNVTPPYELRRPPRGSRYRLRSSEQAARCSLGITFEDGQRKCSGEETGRQFGRLPHDRLLVRLNLLATKPGQKR